MAKMMKVQHFSNPQKNFINLISDLAVIKNELKTEDIKLIMQRSKSRTSTGVSESQSQNGDIRRRASRTSNRQNEDSTVETAKSNDEEQAGDTLIESETAAVGSVAFGVYARYFKSVGYLLIAFVLIFTLSSEAAAVMSNCEIDELLVEFLSY